MINYKQIIYSFIIGGLTVSSISFISNYVSTSTAAILASINLSILATLFINDKQKTINFMWNEIFMTTILVSMAILYYIMFKHFSLNKITVIIICYIWFVLSTLIVYNQLK